MLLKSLELQGFKTFPEKTKLTFENGITAVVGPNGSGKSNISDAMRWVLGEQSAKTLRCSRMEDVIFNGTPNRRGMSCAEVTLTIDNTDRRLAFDGDTVAVTRRFYRSGDSEYLINKASVRLKDIHELFMDTGLGRDGYSMIGQGKIDSIVAARSEDRREIFEEAAGVSRFRYRKEEAERRLARAEDNLVRLRDILSELEGRVGPLKEQAEKAELFLVYSAEKKDLEISVSLAALEKSGSALREQDHKIAASQAEFDEAVAKINALSEEAERVFAETNALTAAMDELRTAAATDDAAAARTEGEIGILRGTVAHNKDTVSRIEREVAQSRLSSEDIGRQITEKEEAARKKSEECDALNARFMELSARVDELRRSLDAGAQDTETLAAAVAAENAAMGELRVQASAARSSIEEIGRRRDAIEEAAEEARAQAEKFAAAEEELTTMASDLQQQITAAENGMQG
ncbi:MAG: AAA family ATPase, partial [Clostridia bacterium]|nr:AAA family ATPase [Clostridia bacterium]